VSLGKKDIVNNIFHKAHISRETGLKLLDHTLFLIKKNSRNRNVKISKFGSFCYKSTPKRIGRNPITKEEFNISETKRLSFKTSNKIKQLLN
jgi:nucleoid DNA-binding protein